MMKKMTKIFFIFVIVFLMISSFASASFANINFPVMSEFTTMILLGISLFGFASFLRGWVK